jgi:signal transduction histidine kinase
MGADQYVEKSAPLDVLADAVRSVAAARQAGVRPEVRPLPQPGAETPRALAGAPPPAPREEPPLEDLLAESRIGPLRPVYVLSIASLAIAFGLSFVTGLPPGVFLLLWLPPILVFGAFAPRLVTVAVCVAAATLFGLAADDTGVPHAAPGAVGVLVSALASAYAARRILVWMQRRVNQQASLAAELRRSNAELEHFAYVASHDLAAPLRSVTSFATMLARRYDGKLDSEADKMLGFITSGTTRMQRMIDDLLAFARSGRVESESAAFSLETVLDQVRTDLAAEIDERGARVLNAPLPELIGDEPRILQVVQNLVANAIKFCPPERAPIVEVSAARLAAGWRIDVRDNGIGIDPRFASKVFGMFQRLHGNDDFPGTGIGLAICQRIVERHGGRIWVDGYEGEGSTFSFTIPDPGD